MKKLPYVPKFITRIPAKVVTDKHGNLVHYHELVEIRPVDFEWLKKLHYNRDLVQQMVEKLGESVIEFGMLRPIVLVKYKSEYFRADGQHLLEFCATDELPVYAFIVPIGDNDEINIMKLIVAMNNTARRWSLTQYAKNWMNFWGKKSDAYKRLNDLKEKYRISFSLLGAMMYGGKQSEAKAAIRQGTFVEKVDPARIDQIISAMENFALHTKISIVHTHTASGLADFITKIGLTEYMQHERAFINAVAKYHKKHHIPAFARSADALEKWMDIYQTIK